MSKINKPLNRSLNRSQQILCTLKYHGVTKAEDLFFATAKLEVGCGGKRNQQAQEYLNNYECGTEDSKWRSSGHYYLRKLIKSGRVRTFGGGMYGLCRKCISELDTKCPSYEQEVCINKPTAE